MYNKCKVASNNIWVELLKCNLLNSLHNNQPSNNSIWVVTCKCNLPNSLRSNHNNVWWNRLSNRDKCNSMLNLYNSSLHRNANLSLLCNNSLLNHVLSHRTWSRLLCNSSTLSQLLSSSNLLPRHKKGSRAK